MKGSSTSAPPEERRPVAYDPEGRPLYYDDTDLENKATSHVTATPEEYEGQNFDPRLRVQYANEPRVVHQARDLEPKQREISEDLKRRSKESKKMFPTINLSPGEYVIMRVKRHPIGLLMPVILTVTLIVLLLLAIIYYPNIQALSTVVTFNQTSISTMLLFMIIVTGLGGYVAIWVYSRNTFYLTNESIIQELQESLFSRREQTVSLGSIEDASFRQEGIIQVMFNYGTIRLSTEGEETTYQFRFVENPKAQIAILANAVESFKNGRPVDDDEN